MSKQNTCEIYTVPLSKNRRLLIKKNTISTHFNFDDMWLNMPNRFVALVTKPNTAADRHHTQLLQFTLTGTASNGFPYRHVFATTMVTNTVFSSNNDNTDPQVKQIFKVVFNFSFQQVLNLMEEMHINLCDLAFCVQLLHVPSNYKLVVCKSTGNCLLDDKIEPTYDERVFAIFLANIE